MMFPESREREERVSESDDGMNGMRVTRGRNWP